MINPANLIRVDRYKPPGKNGGPKKQYIYKCNLCPNEIKIVGTKRLKTATGLCVKCNNARLHPSALEARRLKPFEAMFNRLNESAAKRGVSIALTYTDFLKFTEIKNCHYCLNDVIWKETGSSTYNLDRKDNNIGYVEDNLVVCCAKCNKGKRELYSYYEWYGMTEFLRQEWFKK